MQFDRIREAFPTITMNLDHESEGFELFLDIPAQEGLRFAISLNLQNEDELHLNAGALWVSWFPCDDESVAQKYYLAVTGLLSGRYRIVEYMRGKKCIKAKLQEPVSDGWHTLATSSGLEMTFPFLGKKSMSILRNIQQAD